MVFAFDTLSYARFLRERGVAHEHAEAHAEAARQFIMAELVTRYDLDLLRRELEAKIDIVRHELGALRRDLEGKIDTLSLRLTVRMGVMLAAGVAALAAIIKL